MEARPRLHNHGRPSRIRTLTPSTKSATYLTLFSALEFLFGFERLLPIIHLAKPPGSEGFDRDFLEPGDHGV